jgi:hypothetical protein
MDKSKSMDASNIRANNTRNRCNSSGCQQQQGQGQDHGYHQKHGHQQQQEGKQLNYFGTGTTPENFGGAENSAENSAPHCGNILYPGRILCVSSGLDSRIYVPVMCVYHLMNWRVGEDGVGVLLCVTV